ncbi:MAG: C39 family peptidase, partial [Bacteroidota bacterium]
MDCTLKKLVFYLLFFSNCLPASGQNDYYKVIEIPQHGQRTSNWCWAASMEMIIDAMSSDITQCAIANTYLSSSYRIGSSTGLAPSGNTCLDFCPIDIANNSFNVGLFDKSSGHAHFDSVLTNLDYHAIENISSFAWPAYENEINNCRPMILIYLLLDAGTDDRGISLIPRHAVVGQGYLNLSVNNMPQRYMLINDPLEVCDGRQYLVSEAVLTGSFHRAYSSMGPIEYDSLPSTITVGNIANIVREIYPSESSPETCLLKYTSSKNELSRSLDAPTDRRNDLISLVLKYKSKFIGTANDGIFSQEFTKKFNSKSHFTTPIKYLSYTYFSKRPKSNALQKEKGLIEKNEKEITYTDSDKPLVATIVCDPSETQCMVERIAVSKEPTKKIVLIEGREFILDNTRQKENQSDNRL